MRDSNNDEIGAVSDDINEQRKAGLELLAISDGWSTESFSENSKIYRESLELSSNPLQLELERTWKKIEEKLPSSLKREAVLSNGKWHPMDLIQLYLIHGAYPPPELLLLISRWYGEYLEERDSRTFEEIVFPREKYSRKHDRKMYELTQNKNEKFRVLYHVWKKGMPLSYEKSNGNLPQNTEEGIRWNRETLIDYGIHRLEEIDKCKDKTSLASFFLKELGLKGDVAYFLRSFSEYMDTHYSDEVDKS